MSDLGKGRLVAERLFGKSLVAERFEPEARVYSALAVEELFAEAVGVNVWNDARGIMASTMSVSHADSIAFLVGIKPLAQEDEATRLLREIINANDDKDVSLLETIRKAKHYLARKGQT